MGMISCVCVCVCRCVCCMDGCLTRYVFRALVVACQKIVWWYPRTIGPAFVIGEVGWLFDT